MIENSRQVVIKEVALTQDVLETLLRLSGEWEEEGSCHGYRKNERADIEGNRIFAAVSENEMIGYLFGHCEKAKTTTSIMPEGTPYFEVEEVYVRSEFRSLGVGRKLFAYVEQAVASDVTYIMLSTATKNWRAIAHFYLDELGMEFWNARLFKKVNRDDHII